MFFLDLNLVLSWEIIFDKFSTIMLNLSQILFNFLRTQAINFLFVLDLGR